jgi:hypothetical protein
MAKRIIHLVVKVGDLINKDPDTRDLLRLYFLPDYNVSLAEVIIPGGCWECSGLVQPGSTFVEHDLCMHLPCMRLSRRAVDCKDR